MEHSNLQANATPQGRAVGQRPDHTLVTGVVFPAWGYIAVTVEVMYQTAKWCPGAKYVNETGCSVKESPDESTASFTPCDEELDLPLFLSVLRGSTQPLGDWVAAVRREPQNSGA